MNLKAAVMRIAVAAALSMLAACDVGKPMDIPVPESELTPKPGLFSDDGGEWTIYRKQ